MLTGPASRSPGTIIRLKEILTVSAHESTPINSSNTPSIFSPDPDTGESYVRQSSIRRPGQLLEATD